MPQSGARRLAQSRNPNAEPALRNLADEERADGLAPIGRVEYGKGKRQRVYDGYRDARGEDWDYLRGVKPKGPRT